MQCAQDDAGGESEMYYVKSDFVMEVPAGKIPKDVIFAGKKVLSNQRANPLEMNGMVVNHRSLQYVSRRNLRQCGAGRIDSAKRNSSSAEKIPQGDWQAHGRHGD